MATDEATETETDPGKGVEFWVDPACPWCWVTARWIVDEVAPQRDLTITWRPISLLFKNDLSHDSPNYERSATTHRMLRVMEAIRAELGDSAVQQWYLYCGTKVHHDKDRRFDLAEALEHLGLDTKFAAAAHDESWDAVIRVGMDDGLSLVGDDVGTPIIAFIADDGVRRGIFGPVITKVPPPEQSLAVWDAMRALTAMDDFWEMKRTRSTGPIIPTRLDI
jgi:2-hydroxychromene-2-carboxylate isomerase